MRNNRIARVARHEQSSSFEMAGNMRRKMQNTTSDRKKLLEMLFSRIGVWRGEEKREKRNDHLVYDWYSNWLPRRQWLLLQPADGQNHHASEPAQQLAKAWLIHLLEEVVEEARIFFWYFFLLYLFSYSWFFGLEISMDRAWTWRDG